MSAWKVCCFCVVSVCIVGVWVALKAAPNAAFSQVEGVYDTDQIGRDIKLLYDMGKSGRVAFTPKIGHKISWGSISSESAKLHLEPGNSSDQKNDVHMTVPLVKNKNLPFGLDREDSLFQEEIESCLTSTKPHDVLDLPADRITVCVHVSHGDSLEAERKYPLKFPPDSYYIEQIQTIAQIFKEKPIYVFLMTNDLHPAKLLKRYQKAVPNSNIQWDCRRDPPKNALDDFFHSPRFDCLICCDSNPSIAASKLSEYAIQIAPAHYVKKHGNVRIDGLDVAFNPAYKKIDVAQEKILIAGVCRDTARAVPSIIENAEKLGKRFKDYAVLIYENNSTDNTVTLYSEWAKRNARVVFVSETLPDPSSLRTERIANARNIVLSIAKRAEYHDFKYLVMVDLDFITPWPIDRIIRDIERGGDWDMVAANGINPYGEYYDRYALRNFQFPFGPELLGDAWWWMEIQKGPIRLTADDLIPVFSAFGGLAIYKTASLLPFEYSGTVNHHLYCYYKRILIAHNRKKQNPEIAEYIRQLGHKPTKNLKPIPIVFVENAPTNHPEPLRHVTCCEHVALHASMAMNGHAKLFIDPQMVFVNSP